MSTTLTWLIIVLGLVLSAFLIQFILKKWRLLKEHEQLELHHQQTEAKSQKNAIESVRVLAMCMLEDQMELSEGCIRIKVLLDYLAPELQAQEPFDVFWTMYAETEHMPTHEKRKQTDKRIIFQMDKRRFELEREHEVKILEAAKALLSHPKLSLTIH